MNEYTLVPTTAAVYAAIYATHKDNMTVHESFTDTEGCMHHLGNYKPKMDTRWGFRDADYPLIVNISTKENTEQKDWDHEYYLVSPIKPKE